MPPTGEHPGAGDQHTTEVSPPVCSHTRVGLVPPAGLPHPYNHAPPGITKPGDEGTKYEMHEMRTPSDEMHGR